MGSQLLPSCHLGKVTQSIQTHSLICKVRSRAEHQVRPRMRSAHWAEGLEHTSPQQMLDTTDFLRCPCGYCPPLLQAGSGIPSSGNLLHFPSLEAFHSILPTLAGLTAYCPRSSALSSLLASAYDPLLTRMLSSWACQRLHLFQEAFLAPSGLRDLWLLEQSQAHLAALLILPGREAVSKFPMNRPHPPLPRPLPGNSLT